MHEILTDRAVIQISGPDTVRFLQNLTTNDLSLSDYCYTYMLSNQGRYLFDFFVFKSSQQLLLIDINKNYADLFCARLQLYKLRANIEITDLSDRYQVIYSTSLLSCLVISAKFDPRFNRLGQRIIVEKVALNMLDSSQNLYFQDKYRWAIPDGYDDLMVDRSIPLHYGAEELGAISYTKGCYVGQEVISRTKYQGVIRKKIFKILANQDLSHYLKGHEIIVNQLSIGVFCSSYQNQAIALISSDFNLDLINQPILVNDIAVELSLPIWR